jgi:single-strand DNA-binding protein
MNDTYITVRGIAMTNPERRRTANDVVVAHFKIGSHARRFDRATEEWVDRSNFRIKVNCWRRLADHVCASVFSGDSIIVYGRIVTKDWTNEQGERRISYELEADSVGHDLARGTSVFKRYKADGGTVVEDEEPEGRLDGDLGSLAVPTAFGLDSPVDEALDGNAHDGLTAMTQPDEPENDDEGEPSGGDAKGRKRGRQAVPA